MNNAELIDELKKHDRDAVVLTKSFVPIREYASIDSAEFRVIPNIHKEQDEHPDKYLVIEIK